MKRHMKRLSIPLALSLCLLILSGCLSPTEQEVVIDTKTAILQNMAEVSSVETSITLEMQAHVGAMGDTGAHNANIGSDITLEMTADPLAVHGEFYSRILVDGITTRDDKEYYIVEEDNGIMGKYSYIEESDEWEHTTLTKAESMAVPCQTGLIYDWNAFLGYLNDDKYTETVSGMTCYRLSGEVPTSLLQEFFFGNNVFGSFMYSTEMLLSDTIPCVLHVDSVTYQPVQILFSFNNEFIVSDMTFDTAEVTVTYKDWNEVPAIEIPKKIEIVASDPTEEFYNTFYAWNLFLPYITGGETSGNQGDTPSGEISFTADWSTFQVRIDGGMTQLPILPADLQKIGYVMDNNYGSTIVEPNQYMENIPMRKGQDILYCTFYNPDTVAQPIGNCIIGALDLSYTNNANNSIQVYLPGEVSLGITKDALTSAYGEPDFLERAFASDTYTWYGDIENESFMAEISTVNNQVIRIYLKNIPVTGGKQ